MVVKKFVKSFYTSVLVTCYEYNGIKYVANQHGNWDVYEGKYERGERTRSIHKEADEIKKIIHEYRLQELEKK